MKRFISLLLSITIIISIVASIDLSSYAASSSKETWDDGYIVIRTVEDLIGINDDLSAKYRLANDIDLSSVENWIPIGDTIRYLDNKIGTGYTEKSDGSYFGGVLDGANHKIINLSINKSLNDSEDATNVYEFGLFANILNAAIENLIFENVYIDVDSTNLSTNHSLVGALAGSSENAYISNCIIKNSKLNNINGIASGVVGNAFSDAYTTFNDVINYSSVSGYTSSGIALGYTNFEYCANIGQINGGNVGGISAGGNASLYHCYNTGEITGTKYVGGIIGRTEYERNSANSIMNCNNYGIINYNGATYCGGIVGEFFIQNKPGTIKNCNNFGTINYTPNDSVGYMNCCGGIVGDYSSYSQPGVFENCSNYGDINAILTSHTISSVDIGGICGNGAIDQLTKMINYGNIISNSSGDISICAGGICGSVYCHNANDVYNYGDLTFKNVNQTVGTTNTFLSVGGLFAQGDSTYIHANIGNEGNITVNGNIYSAHIGGLFQNLYNDSTITNAYNTGNISVIDNDVYDDAIRIGGIFACYLNDDNSLNISNAYSSGDISLSRENYTVGKIFVGNIYGENPKGGTIKLNNFYTKYITTYGACDSNLDGQINILDDFSNQNNFNGFDFSNTWTLQNGKYPTINFENNNEVVFFDAISNNILMDRQTLDYEIFSDVEISKYYFGTSSLPKDNEFITIDGRTNLSLSFEISSPGYYILTIVDKDGKTYNYSHNFYEFDFASKIGDTVPNKILVSNYTWATTNYYILPMPDCQEEIFNGWSTKENEKNGIFVLTDDSLKNYTTTLYATYDLSKCNHPETYEWVEFEQSCTQDGYTYDRCVICDEIVEQHIFEKTGHSYSVTKVVEPRCNSKGYSVYTCSNCGDSYISDYKDATGIHTYVSSIVQATADHQGFTKHTCKVCGDTYATDYFDAATVYGENTVGKAGETVKIPVYIKDNNGNMSWELMLDYDTNVLTPISVEKGNIIDSGCFDDNIANNMESESIKVHWSGDDNKVYNGIMFYISFAVEKNYIGNTQIDISYVQNDTYDAEYNDVYFNCEPIILNIENSVELSSISIAKQPSKKVYYVGDSLDTSGLQLKLTYSDDSTETVSSGYTTSGFSSTTAGTKTVTITYEGLTTTFIVTVNAPSISISSSSKTMTVGDTATLTSTTTPSGQAVTWTSSDTSVATVSNGTITAKAAGTANITAKFTYNGYTYSKICTVTVSAPKVTLTSVSVAAMPTKTVYEIGDTLNTAGLKLKLTYSDGSTKTVTSGFIVSSPDMTTAGIKTVTVDYQGKTTSFTITVNPKEIPNPNGAKITVDNKTVIIGNMVEVAVKLENNPGIASMTLRVNYDSSAMKLISVTDSGKLGTAVHSDNYSSPYTLCWVNDTATENFTANGTIVTLKFQILDDAVVGSYPVAVSYGYDNYDIYNTDVEKVKFDTVNGNISISNVLIGDVNSDGVVNNLDRLVLTRYLANWVDYPESAINMTAADVNMDGTVNNLDRLILTRHLANWNGYDELPYIKP